MMKRTFLSVALAGCLAFGAWAQDAPSSHWTIKNVGGVNLSQTSLTNWAAGGENTVAWHVYYNGIANYKKGKLNWDNGLVADFGQNYTSTNKWQKSLDKLNFNTKVGYSFAQHWNASFLADFLTQFATGYSKATDKANGVPYISNFMAPAYLSLSLGADYRPAPNFSLLISPLAGKVTFVMDKSLSAAGRYGVKPGERVLAEAGATLVANYNTHVTKDLNLITKLTLFTAYNNHPGYIDVNWDTMLAYKFNKYLTANLTTNLIYDDDIKTVDAAGNKHGARVQLRQVLGFGLSYTF